MLGCNNSLSPVSMGTLLVWVNYLLVFLHRNYLTLKKTIDLCECKMDSEISDCWSLLEITLEIWIVTLIMWDCSFVVNNKPQDSKLFIRTLVKVPVCPFATVCTILFNSCYIKSSSSKTCFVVAVIFSGDHFRHSYAVRYDSVLLIFKFSIFQQERQELGERVMVTRLHLFNKWVKVSPHYHLWKKIYGLCHKIWTF